MLSPASEQASDLSNVSQHMLKFVSLDINSCLFENCPSVLVKKVDCLPSFSSVDSMNRSVRLNLM